jgi:hypothetical protein
MKRSNPCGFQIPQQLIDAIAEQAKTDMRASVLLRQLQEKDALHDECYGCKSQDGLRVFQYDASGNIRWLCRECWKDILG